MVNARRDPYRTAAWIALPFVALLAVDGLWKAALLRGARVWFWIYDLAVWILIPILLLALLSHLTRLRGRDYGLSADLGVTDILYVLPLPLFSLFAANIVATWLTGSLLGYPEPRFTYASALASLDSLWIVGTIYLSVTAGLWESIFSIALPWLWLSRGERMSDRHLWSFALASAIVFGVSHGENGVPNAIGAGAFQLFAVWWYVRLKTLWPVIGAHFLIDLYYFWPPARI